MAFSPFDHGFFATTSPSSSQSSLSPLALPFTVDRLPPPSPISVAPPSTTFDIPYDNWLHLHSSTSAAPSSIPPPNPQINPVGARLGFLGSNSIAFALPEASKNISFRAEPYYPQFTASIHDGSASNLAYGVSDSGNSFSDGSYGSGYGSPPAEGLVMPEEAFGVWHGKCAESIAKNPHIGLQFTGSERLDITHKAISHENAGSFKTSGSSVLAPSSLFEDMSYSRISDVEPPKEVWNPLGVSRSPYGKCFPHIDSCPMGGSNIFSSGTYSLNMFGPSLEKTTSTTLISADQSGHTRNRSDKSFDYASAYSNAEGTNGTADANKTNDEFDENSHKLLGFSATNTVLPVNVRPPISVRYILKENSNLEGNGLRVHIPDTSVVHASRTSDSMEFSEIPDQVIPSIDSPCWKGASSFQNPPFGVVEESVHLSVVNESRDFYDLNNQTRLFPSNVVHDEAVSFLKLDENLVSLETENVNKGSLPAFARCVTSVDTFPCMGFISTDANKIGPECLKVGDVEGIQFSSHMQESRNRSCFELQALDVKSLGLGKDGSFHKECMSDSIAVDPELHPNYDAQNVFADSISHAMENASNVPSSGGMVSKERDDSQEASSISCNQSPPRLNTQILLNILHNISELLLACHVSDNNALKELDREVLKLVAGNLDACVSNKIANSRPKLTSFSRLGSSFCLQKSINPQKGTIAGGAPVVGKETNGVVVDIHDLSIPSSEKCDKFHNVCSGGNKSCEGDNDIAQTFEKVIKESILENAEKHPETLLYKNLWIEAEAALCSLKYELRLAQMKIEMERCKLHQTADSHYSSDTEDTEVANSSDSDSTSGCRQNVSSVPKHNDSSTDNVTSVSEGAVLEGCHRRYLDEIQGSSLDDSLHLEESVLARFKILQNRIENSGLACKSLQTKQPDEIHNGDQPGKASSISCLERKLMEDALVNDVDLGLTRMKNPWPFVTNRVDNKFCEVGDKLDMAHMDVKLIDDTAVGLDLSKQEMMNKSAVHAVDELVSELLVTPHLGNQLSPGGCESPSSDWEHVLKEELIL